MDHENVQKSYLFIKNIPKIDYKSGIGGAGVR